MRRIIRARMDRNTPARLNPVRQMKAANLSSEAAQAQGLHPKWQTWGNSAITEDIWIDEIYRSLDAVE